MTPQPGEAPRFQWQLTKALFHRLRHPTHNVTRWGLAMPHLVCLNCDKEWLPSDWWRRRLSR